MKLKKLVLENFRLFKNLEIDFPDSNVIALIGNNGGGKTSVLDAVSKTMGGLIKELDLKYANNEDTINNSDVKIQETKASTFGDYEFCNKRVTVNCRQENYYEGFIDVEPDSWYKCNNDKIKPSSSVFPILVYYRVNRTTTINKGTFHKIIEPASAAYSDALDAKTSSFSKFEDWFINELTIENEYIVKHSDFSFQLPSLKNVRSAFKLFLGKLGANAITDIRIDRDANAIDFNIDNNPYAVVIKNNEELRLGQLSAGEKMILYMVSDIARRLTIANSHSENALQGEGIVLIDELDLHLHPKWQREIVKALTTTFPNVQFIFTTHSPLIISGIRRENLIVLNDGEIIPSTELPNVYSGTADEIIEQIQFAKFNIDEFEEERKEIDLLFNKMDFEKAAIKLDALKKKVNANPKWLKDYELRISFAMS